MSMILRQIAKLVVRNLLRVFWIFPIKKNRVVFCSYGISKRLIACNPKYVYLKLRETYGDKFEYVLVEDSYEKEKYPGNVVSVKFRSVKFIYYTLTSKVFVTNSGFSTWLPFRKKQFLINTWHGGGAYKIVGIDERIDNVGQSVLARQSKLTNLYLSSCRNFTKEVIRGSFLYNGEVLEIGMPRNDVLLNAETSKKLSQKVKEYYQISENTKIVLWAPTYRGNDRNNKFAENSFYHMDVKRLIKSLERRFGGEWCIFYRFHYYTTELKTLNDEGVHAIDANRYEDMQELLCAADVLITDYSSSMWDFSLTGKPGFLYTPDLQRYIDERGLEKPIETWPYPYAKSNDELEKIILEYDPVKGREKIKKHHEMLGICETGHASEIVCKRIYEECFGKE